MLKNLFGNDRNRVFEKLKVAMSLFTSGHRSDAIPFLESILSSHSADASIRTTASCLMGETYRGMGDFSKARQMYELAIYESNTIPDSMQILDGFVSHYRPRAFCGLLTVYRRLLFDDHSKIQSLIREIKSDFMLFRIEDLPAQINLMEGLYMRQLGEVGSSVAFITEGLDAVRNIQSPYFLFLHPEHFEAFLMISHLCSSSESFQTRKISREILKANRGPWSIAFAAAAQIHLYLRQAADGEYKNFSSNEFGQDSEKVTELIHVLQKNARFENDPLLLSECLMLSLIWYLLTENFTEAAASLSKLTELLPKYSAPLMLLRGVEIGALQHELEIAGIKTGAEKIIAEARDAFSDLSKALGTYGCQEHLLQYWRCLLFEECLRSDYILEIWTGDKLNELRRRVWP